MCSIYNLKLKVNDAHEYLVLALLDVSIARNTADYGILNERLRTWVGISFLLWTFSDAFANFWSFSAIQGPNLFPLYMLPLGQILVKLGLHPYYEEQDGSRLSVYYYTKNWSSYSCLFGPKVSETLGHLQFSQLSNTWVLRLLYLLLL